MRRGFGGLVGRKRPRSCGFSSALAESPVTLRKEITNTCYTSNYSTHMPQTAVWRTGVEEWEGNFEYHPRMRWLGFSLFPWSLLVKLIVYPSVSTDLSMNDFSVDVSNFNYSFFFSIRKKIYNKIYNKHLGC